jgi:hypothetical protein
MTTYNYPYGSDDSNRDYLVLHHIAAYHEYPLTGPFAAVTRSRNSPSYYYLIAPFAFIKDDPIFLREVNIILQIATIFVIFLLARKLYGDKAAIIASVIISFNSFSLVQSAFLWQPWVMQPFINLSYLLLVIAGQKKNYFILLASVFCFIFAGSIHTSVFALTPVFFIILILILRNQNAHLKRYLGVLGVTIFSFLLFYLPVLVAFIKNTATFSPLSSSNIVGIYNTSQIALNFIKNVTYFVGGIFFYKIVFNNITSVFTLIISLILAYYFHHKKSASESIYSLSITLSLVVILLCFSVINVRIINSSYGIHYFTPVYGLFIILLSRACVFIFSKNKFTKIIGLLLFSTYMGFFISGTYKMFYKNKTNFSMRYLDDPAINSIKKDVISIKKSGSYENFDFFSVRSHGGGNFGWRYTATVWAVLERQLNARLVRLDNYNQDGFTQINQNPKYIFLVCPATSDYKPDKGDCGGNYLEQNKNYSYEKNTYSNDFYRIDLLKRAS